MIRLTGIVHAHRCTGSLACFLLCVVAACGLQPKYLSRTCADINLGNSRDMVADACGTPGRVEHLNDVEYWYYGTPNAVTPNSVFGFDANGTVISTGETRPEPSPANLRSPVR